MFDYVSAYICIMALQQVLNSFEELYIYILELSQE